MLFFYYFQGKEYEVLAAGRHQNQSSRFQQKRVQPKVECHLHRSFVLEENTIVVKNRKQT